MGILLLPGIVISWFLSAVLATKKGKAAPDYLLALWLFSIGYILFGYYLFITEAYLTYPTLVLLGMPLPLTQGPFLYLYTKYQTRKAPFRKSGLLHFLPVLLSLLFLFGGFFFLPFEQKVEAFRQAGKGYEIQAFINLAGIYISGLVYIPLTLWKLVRYRKNLKNEFSNTERIQFNWLLYLVIGIGLIWIPVWFIREEPFVYGSASVFVILLGFFGIRQAGVLGHAPPGASAPQYIPEEPEEPAGPAAASKYQKSSLTGDMAAGIYERLVQLMQDEKPYLNPELTLGELAGLLGIHPNHLSQVVNAMAKKNFYDFVNGWRIEEFLRIAEKPESKQFTLLALAFDCGFNSKASFNRNFRNYTGHAPTEYLSRQGSSPGEAGRSL